MPVFRAGSSAASASPAPRRAREGGRPAHLRLVAQTLAVQTSAAQTSAAQAAADRDAGERMHRAPTSLRPLRRPTDVALRLAIWAEAARAAGDKDRADRLCLMAWDAYDRPVRDSAPTVVERTDR